jgi:hypothetical protein
MIVFGGTTDIYAYENDLWVLSNANGVGAAPTWQAMSPRGDPPPVRAAHAAVYDAPNNRMIVFGGATYTAVYSDVWVLSNANGMTGDPVWSALAPSGTIPGLASPSAAYDASSNTLFVFGGYLSTTTLEVTNGVWALSNANGLGGVPAWKQLQVDISSAGAPAARLGHSMLYDEATGHILVFGGTESTGTTMFNDVWLLVNPGGLPRWTPLPTIGEPPAPRVFHTAVLDPVSRRMTVYAGGSKEGNFFSVWTLEVARAA